METWGIDDWRHVLYTLIVLEICVILYIFIEAVYSATIMVTSDLRWVKKLLIQKSNMRTATIKYGGHIFNILERITTHP